MTRAKKKLPKLEPPGTVCNGDDKLPFQQSKGRVRRKLDEV